MIKRPAFPLAGLLALALVVLPQPKPGFTQTKGFEPAAARLGMVASSSEIASNVGVEILKQGGNAVDASVAVGLALAVTYPAAGNLGGGGFMMVRLANGTTTAIDFRETAPGKSTRDLYVDSSGKVISEASTVGHRASGVPGTVAGFGLALKKYGKLPWKTVIEPARRLAEEGFTVSPTLARELRASRLLARFPESRRIFHNGGKFYQTGDRFKQPELAETLGRLKSDGPEEFYEGKTSRLIAQEMRQNNGLITREDLKNYRPVERVPLRGSYRGHDIITMPPPSSGGIALLETLNILEPVDLKAMGPFSARRYHYLVEAMRRAFADRSQYPGDPEFARVPVRGLTSKRYGAELFKTIDANEATRSEDITHGRPQPYESEQTTHFSVVDAQGNAAATTYTLNGSYGSGVTVKEAGFLLNNEMDDFTAKPGVPNLFGLIQGEANAIQPGKRPLSSMTPTFVLKGGELLFAVGSPGGPTIINTVLQTILNVVDHDMNLQEAVAAPRLHHQWMPDEIAYERFFSDDTKAPLIKMGHKFADAPRYLGDVQAVMIDPQSGERLGVSDPRSPDGRAVGY